MWTTFNCTFLFLNFFYIFIKSHQISITLKTTTLWQKEKCVHHTMHSPWKKTCFLLLCEWHIIHSWSFCNSCLSNQTRNLFCCRKRVYSFLKTNTMERRRKLCKPYPHQESELGGVWVAHLFALFEPVGWNQRSST